MADAQQPPFPQQPGHAPTAADTQPISVPPPPPGASSAHVPPGASSAHVPPPGAPSAHVPPAVAHGAPGSSPTTARTLLHVLAAVLVVVGISLPLDGSDVLWVSSATWAAFATAAALAQLAALAGRDGLGGRAWWIGAAGAGGLVLFWTLLMLPAISTNMAFLVTLGTAAAVTGVLISPDRRI